MKYNLDKLKKVDLRDVWPHEALDFTRWLSEEPNLAILSSAVGIELELIETESSVGRVQRRHLCAGSRHRTQGDH